MPFRRYAPFDSAKALTDAVNNAKTQYEHDKARHTLDGYKMRCDETGLHWPCIELDLSLPDDGRPVCCGVYMDWEPIE